MNFGNEYQNQTMDNMSMSNTNANMCGMNCCQADPIYECPEEKVCHRYICYDVPHIKPCNTRIINHHIYKHSYVPNYTCCEENECCNVYDNCQNNFF